MHGYTPTHICEIYSGGCYTKKVKHVWKKRALPCFWFPFPYWRGYVNYKTDQAWCSQAFVGGIPNGQNYWVRCLICPPTSAEPGSKWKEKSNLLEPSHQPCLSNPKAFLYMWVRPTRGLFFILFCLWHLQHKLVQYFQAPSALVQWRRSSFPVICIHRWFFFLDYAWKTDSCFSFLLSMDGVPGVWRDRWSMALSNVPPLEPGERA